MATNTSYSLTVEEHPSEPDLRFVLDSIRQFNLRVSGHGPPRPVAYFLRNEQGRILGGVLGDLWGSSMHVAALWVAESERGKGQGSALLLALENYAAANGHNLCYVETTSFQALPFYEKLGYQIFGQLPGIAAQCTLFFLKKDLNP